MEPCQETFCRFCLSDISDCYFQVIEEEKTIITVLNILLLKLNVEDKYKSVMCNDCSTKLFAAYQFKITCMDTESCIFPYVNSECAEAIDLREIYLKKNKEHLAMKMEYEKICRLCMQIITSEFASVEDVGVDLICKYIPEINFSATREPAICAVCFDALNTHGSFLVNCLEVEEKIKISYNDKVTNSPFHIIKEEVEIKSEKNEFGNAYLHDDYDHAEGEAGCIDGPQLDHLKHENTSGVQKHRCSLCDYQTYRKSNFIRHQLRHKDFSEVPVFRCHECDYKTKYKFLLMRHDQSIHKASLQKQKYECDVCDFTTMRKNCLTIHRKKHRIKSPPPMHKCDVCNYENKRKSALEIHQLTHKNVSDVPVYQCDTCDFKSRYRTNLRRHRQGHKDISEVRTYKCDRCDYVARRKGCLVVHQLTHEKPSEATMYKCDKCEYESKKKSELTTHQLIHKECCVQAYYCEACDYQSREENAMKFHRLVHEKVTEVRRLDKTNDLGGKRQSEVHVFRCNLCGFETNRKFNLLRHHLVHKDHSEVEMYKCDLCDFETKCKVGLRCHQLVHKNLSVD